MDFVVKNTEKTDEKMRKQESKFKQLEALTTGMINPIKNCSIKPNHWKAKHGFGEGVDVLRIHNRSGSVIYTRWEGCQEQAGCCPPRLLAPGARGSDAPATAILHRQGEARVLPPRLAPHPFSTLVPVPLAGPG